MWLRACTQLASQPALPPQFLLEYVINVLSRTDLCLPFILFGAVGLLLKCIIYIILIAH